MSDPVAKLADLQKRKRGVLRSVEEPSEPPSREADLLEISKALRFEVERVERVGVETVIHGQKDGVPVKVTIPDGERAFSPKRVAVDIYQSLNLVVKLGGQEVWLGTLERIARVAEWVAVPSDEDETLSWVRKALRSAPAGDLRKPENLNRLATLYAEEDRFASNFAIAWREGPWTVVRLEHLASYLTEFLHLRISHKALGARLRAAGFVSRQLEAPREGRSPLRRRLWIAATADVEEEV